MSRRKRHRDEGKVAVESPNLEARAGFTGQTLNKGTLNNALNLATWLHDVSDEQLDFYNEEGKRKYRDLTAQVVAALQSGEYLRALRISNYIDSRYVGLILGGAKEHPIYQKIEPLHIKFKMLIEATKKAGNVDLYEHHTTGELAEPFEITTNSPTEPGEIAHLIDKKCGYYAASIWGDSERAGILAFPIPEAPPLARIKGLAPNKFQIRLIQMPLGNVGQKELADYVNASLGIK